MAELVNFTIDGRTVSAPKGSTIWQAANAAGLFIPIYCYHPKMSPLGACRICLVEVEKMPKPMAACTTTITEGMVVKTTSQMAEDARAGVMEFLLINHPLDCPICDKGGECDLQNYAVDFGRSVGRYREEKRHLNKAVELGPTIALDQERCIMCQRCVRFCSEVVQDEGLVIVERGAQAQISTYPGQPYDSQFSGNTIEMCPVGALTSRAYRFKARPWELRHINSVCVHCPVGCNIDINTRLGRDVVRFTSRVNDDVDDGWLCDRGRFGYGLIHSQDRLKSPMLRKNGKLEPVAWKEAFDYIVARLNEIQSKHGAGVIAAIGGTTQTNEELYLFQKFARQTLGTDKVAHRAGSFGSLKVTDLPNLLTATIKGMDKAKVILLAGTYISEMQPVLELRLKKARRLGAKLVFLGGRPGPLTRFAHQIIEAEPHTLLGLVQNLTATLNEQLNKFEELNTLTATIKAANGEVAVWFDESATLAPSADDLAGAMLKLAQATGSLGKPDFGLGVLTENNNSTGARDIAAMFPSSMNYGAFLSGTAGVKAAYVMGSLLVEDSLLFGGKEDKLAGLELLVVHDMFLSRTAQLAHVVLPVSSFAEIDGTFTNLEGRVQRIKPAIIPVTGTAPNIAIMLEISSRLGKPLPGQNVPEIFDEIASQNAAYAGLSYEGIGPQGALRPVAVHRSPEPVSAGKEGVS